MTSGEPYTFRPLTPADLPRMADWFAQPHVARWFDPPETEMASLRDNWDRPWVERYLVLHEDAPLGYLQACRIDDDPEPAFAGCPRGAVGVDLFVGDPAQTGRGHGPALLAAFARRLFAETAAPCILVDPDRDNAAAIRCYRKAGFREAAMDEPPHGPTLIMVLDRPQHREAAA